MDCIRYVTLFLFVTHSRACADVGGGSVRRVRVLAGVQSPSVG